MIDKRHIGTSLPCSFATPPAQPLRFFAQATGESHPFCLDAAAARDPGHPQLPLFVARETRVTNPRSSIVQRS